MLIQVKYHMGNYGNIAINDSVLGINYHGWATVHKISIVVLSVFVIYHIYEHWKWYKIVITKRLFAKNQQVLIFSLLFVLVAITGLTPWFIDLLKGDEIQRKTFIEIHDKFAIILTIYLILHIIKRMKWFFTTFDKIRNKHSTQHRVQAIAGSGFTKDHAFGYLVLPRSQCALATQRLIHANVMCNSKTCLIFLIFTGSGFYMYLKRKRFMIKKI